MQIRKAILSDTEKIYNIDKMLLGLGWSYNQILDTIKEDNLIKIYVCEAEKDVICAYIICQILDKDVDILRIGVENSYRRCGLGSKLINAITDTYKIKNMYLEVRSKNTNAINFYIKNGFKKIQVRPNFYKEPDDDAIIMIRSIEEINV